VGSRSISVTRRRLRASAIEAAQPATPPPTMREQTLSDYQKALSQPAPSLSDYHPSIGRRIAGGVLGALAGAHDAKSGVQTGHEITYGPFERQMSDYQQALARKKEAYETAEKGELDKARLGVEDERAGAERARAGAEESRRKVSEFGISPEGWEREKEKLRIQHPEMRGTPPLFNIELKNGEKLSGIPEIGGRLMDPMTNTVIGQDAIKSISRIGTEGKTVTTKAPAVGTFGDFLGSYAKKVGKATEDLTEEDKIKAREEWSVAGETPALRGQRTGTAARASETGGQSSYNRMAGMLDKDFNIMDAARQRLSNLESTLGQNNAQADALVFPELLSSIVGGTGTGFRMTQAEINNAVGGRTMWESLQATANKLKTDPQHAQIPDNQRAAIRNLERALRGKLDKRLSILHEHDKKLAETNDPMEHRRIMAEFRKRLTDLDIEKGSGELPGGVTLDEINAEIERRKKK